MTRQLPPPEDDADTHTFDGDTCVVCLFDAADFMGGGMAPCRTRVVNKNKHQYHIDVTRAGPWGNPFRIGRDGDRAAVIAKYEAWIVMQPQLMRRLPELRGRILGCVCDPLDCHAHVLARLADGLGKDNMPCFGLVDDTDRHPCGCAFEVGPPGYCVEHHPGPVSDPCDTKVPVSIDPDLDLTTLLLDVETTGTDDKAQIIELAVQFGFDGEVRAPTKIWRFKPSVPIHPGAERVHGISEAMLMHELPFTASAQAIAEMLDSCTVVVGYNVKFDLEKILYELVRAKIPPPDLKDKIIVDTLRLWHYGEPRTLAAAHRRFVGGDFDNAHSAAADIAATANVTLAMIEQFGLGDRTWAEIADLCEPERKFWLGHTNHLKWQDGAVVITFGKHKDAKVTDPSVRGYLTWMQKQDFPMHVMEVAAMATKLREPAFLAWAAQKYPPPMASE